MGGQRREAAKTRSQKSAAVEASILTGVSTSSTSLCGQFSKRPWDVVGFDTALLEETLENLEAGPAQSPHSPVTASLSNDRDWVGVGCPAFPSAPTKSR